MSAMRIAIIGKSDRNGGGASKCSGLLQAALTARGHVVDWFTVAPTPPGPGRRALLGALGTRAAHGLHFFGRRVLGGEFFPVERPALGRLVRDYDVVHVNDHWRAVSPWSMRWLAARVPTVITLHDASYFTGGCLYPCECTRYDSGCGACPQRAEMRMPVDVTAAAWRLKRTLLRKAAPVPTAPSRWMAELARHSPWVRETPRVIVNAVDAKVFNPGVRVGARAYFGLGAHERVVLLAASSLADSRKGIGLAVAALRQMGEAAPAVLLLGHGGETLRAQLPGRAAVAGFAASDEAAARAYAAADLFIFPSLADNCPLSVLESLAVGTPVVAFERGGTPELIDDGATGVVVREIGAGALVTAMRPLLADGLRLAAMGAAAARMAAERFSLDRYGREHEQLYEEVRHVRHG